MTVFYSILGPRRREYSFINWLGNVILDDVDISYWVVPGTLDLED